MKLLLRLAIIIWLLIGSIMSLYAQQVFRRTIEKSCPVVVKAISIDHKHSNVTIAQWDKQEIEMTAEIITNAASIDDAKKMSECIDVKFFPNLSEGTKIQTSIDHNKLNNITRNRNNYSINISIKAPRALMAIVKMAFGNTTINVPLKSLTIDGDYGNFKATTIDGACQATIKYGNLTIDKIEGMLNASTKYGNLTVGEGQDMNISAEYGNANIQKANVVKGFVRYGSLDITRATDVIMSEVGFSNCKVGSFQNVLTVSSLRYGSLTASTTENFKSIYVKSEFSPVRITLSGSPSYTCDLFTQFSEIKSAFPVTSTVTSTKGDSYNTSIKGVVGNGGNKSIEIKNRYGSIAIVKQK